MDQLYAFVKDKPTIMQKGKFVTDFFRALAILTPILMILKSMIDKRFKSIRSEIIVIIIYIVLIIFLVGFIIGSNMN